MLKQQGRGRNTDTVVDTLRYDSEAVRNGGVDGGDGNDKGAVREQAAKVPPLPSCTAGHLSGP